MKMRRHLLSLITFVCLVACAQAQVNATADALIYSTDEGLAIPKSDTHFTIKDIQISGNKKTKAFVILRELPFKQDEQYPLNELVDKFEATKRQLMNTGLFRSVVVSLKSMQGYDVYVSIEVKERWYVYPVPLVKTVDRNIN